MARHTYTYNKKTLRYDRARVSPIGVVLSIIGLLSFGSLFFIGLFVLQNYFINTPDELALRLENRALVEHQKILASHLNEASSKLTNLQKEEEELYSKFFDLALEKPTVSKNQEVLLSNANQFDATIEELTSRLQQSHSRAVFANNHYSSYASVTRADVPVIAQFPGGMPVENIEPKMLVSGFGTRINPWHKGKYHHDGVDIAGARGSKILATGTGRVTTVKNSDLQAGFGNYIEIDHGNGYVTRYAHLGEVTVRVGQKVKKGELIGLMGVSGGSIAPHVHYEVTKNGRTMDPVRMMVEGITSNQFSLLAVAGQQLNQSLD